MTVKELNIKSLEYRKKVLKYITQAKGGHTGGSLSSVDILNVLYNEILNVSPDNFDSPERDRYIQSKGHSVESLYVVLADVGFYKEEELNTMGQYQSHFVGHPTRKVSGIEQNTGALGHGLSFSAGLALAGKKDKRDYRVFTLLGDGELAEGSNWEAMMFAAHNKLDNLVAILDHNTLQITGKVKEVCSIYPLEDKLKAFGWEVNQVDGNDVSELKEMLRKVPFNYGKPSFIIANTIKGKGISFIENAKEWHHKVPSEEQYNMAIRELDRKIEMELVREMNGV